MCAAAVAGTVVLAAIATWLFDREVITSDTAKSFVYLGISTWKLAWAYAVSTVQGRTFGVYVYYGGQVRASGSVLAIGYWLRPLVLSLAGGVFWRIIVSGGW